MFKILNKISELCFLSKNEKKFIENKVFFFKKKNIFLKKKNILIQTTPNYFHLLYFKILFFFKFKEFNVYGLWPEIVKTYTKNKILYIIKKIIFNFHQRKWNKIYKCLGILFIFNLNFEETAEKRKLLKKSIKIFKSIKLKEDILKIKFKDIWLGDLIYDTYLRFKCEPTVNIKDKFLLDLIYISLKTIKKIDLLHTKYNFCYFISSYAVYINHGIVVRFFLKNKVPTYTNGSPYYCKLKKLSKKDFLHTATFKNFRNEFSKLKNKKKLINLAKKELRNKFRGKEDISTRNNFVLNNTYKSIIKYEKNLIKVEGVLFLHDFFDSPHLWGNIIFNDFYEWTIYTLELIKNNDLKIGIKLHPNSKPESLETNKYLRKKYNELIWINENLSNNAIFKSPNILYGISCYGSILYELPLFNKTAFSAGDNPTSSFDITVRSKNIKDYKNKIINAKNFLKNNFNKNEVYKFYYMYFLKNLNKNNLIENKFANNINLVGVNRDSNDKYLSYYDNKIVNYLKKNNDFI